MTNYRKTMSQVLSEMYSEELTESAEAGLKAKADKSGMPLSVLKKVYDRGVAAWKGGHRPGTTPQQWGMARVNSFVTKSDGTWGKADADLAKQVRGESVNEEKFAGWIAIYKGKKLEIKKNEADTIYGAKLKAIKDLKVPKSQQGLLAIKPAYEEFVKENPEDMQPASPDESSMAMQQLEFMAYAADKMKEHLSSGGEFPEWMQNKLSATHEDMKSLYANIDHDKVEAVSAAQQAAIAISKKERGEKPKGEK